MEIGLVLMLAFIMGAIAWLKMDDVLTTRHISKETPDALTGIQETIPKEGNGGNTSGSGLRESIDWFGKIFNFTGDPLDRRYSILHLIASDQSLDYNHLEDRFDVSRKTIKRDLKVLKDLNLITFTGAPKTGKYTFTEFGRLTWQTL